jgi:DNA segregation ATPase FtsK/SpoIIIE, S-DNA-T family
VNQPGTDRKVRLQHQLKLQSMQIERVLDRHNVSAQVAGGSVEPRSIIFDLQTHLATGLDRLREVKQELMMALGVADVELRQENGRFHIQVARHDDPPVALLDLIEAMPDLAPATAVLGLAADGRPLLLDFGAEQLPHMLLVGEPGAGKTALLRTLAVSLAHTSRQSQVQLVIIDPHASDQARIDPLLEPLDYLPHMLAPLMVGPTETAELLNFLVAEMNYRSQQQVNLPAIAVLIDRADWLLDQGGPAVRDAIIQVAQRGETAGIHLVLSVQSVDNPALSNILKANLPVRLVGQVADNNAARNATGVAYSQAEHLLGQGDFLAVADGNVTHFQAAFLDDYELHLLLEQLYARRPPPLLAQPAVAALPPQAETVHRFVRDEVTVTMAEESEPDPADDEADDELFLAFDAWGESLEAE